MAALVARTLAEHGRIDILVTAAGVARFGPVAEVATADWDQTLAVNLRGALLCCRAVLPPMIGRAARHHHQYRVRGDEPDAHRQRGVYGVQVRFARLLAGAGGGDAPHGVRVGVLSAGATDTPLWDGMPGAPDRARMLTPAQVAEAALLMAGLGSNAALEELTLLPAGGVL